MINGTVQIEILQAKEITVNFRIKQTKATTVKFRNLADYEISSQFQKFSRLRIEQLILEI